MGTPRLKCPDLPDGPLNNLFREVFALYGMAHRATTRRIAEKTSISHTTVHKILTSGELPALGDLLEVVDSLRQLAPDVKQAEAQVRACFIELWQLAFDAQSNGKPVYGHGMVTEWRKSSFSFGEACVEVRLLGDSRIALRDSKDRSMPPHYFTSREWEAFLEGARNGGVGLHGDC